MNPPSAPAYLAAAIQFTPRFGDRAWNTDRLVHLTEQAFGQGAKLVVHPEMATTGYAWQSRAEIAAQVEPVPGPTGDRFAELARQYGGWIVAGLPEVDPAHGGYYNTAALIGPDGLAGKYRKTHSYITEVRWARDGDVGLPVFDTPLGRLGILICMDAEYPEPARILAQAGCDVVCFPTNWLDEKSPSAYWLQRAWENGTYWICANRLGLERGVQFSGGSAIVGPDGEVLSTLDNTDGVVIAEIDPRRSAAARQRKLADRRPRLYQAMTLNSYLWPGVHVANRGDSDALDGIGPVQAPPAVRLAVHHRALAADGAAANVQSCLARWPADLTAFPSLRPANTGGTDADYTAISMADRFDDLTLTLARFAKAHDCAIVAGAPRSEGGCLFDAVILALPDGALVIHHSTQPGADRQWAQPGNQEPPVVRTAFGLFGLLSGDELLCPEPARGLAARGAEFIVAVAALDNPAPTARPATDVPLAAGMREQDSFHWFLPRVRAAENNVWLLFANAGALTSGIFGPSFYRSPRRDSLAAAGSVRMELTADGTDRDRQIALEKPYLRMRALHLYSTLTM